MEHASSSSEASTSSRRNNHSITSHPKDVQFHQSSRPTGSSSSEESQRNSTRPNGHIRRSVDHINKEDGFNEQSPLLAPQSADDVGKVPAFPDALSPGDSGEESTWDTETGGTKEETKSTWYLVLLTISFLGLQIAWSVELSNGSPYLLSLGITKSFLAFVWIAGPLSGTLVQPYVGIKSDRCRSRFGKRRPFMVGGAAATIVSLMILAWTREIVGGFLAIFGVSRESQGTKTTSIILAVIMVYVLDFSINVIQAAIRAFVVDNAPTHQQDSANAWASRILGVGNIIGYLFGYADLPRYLWFFGDTQFKILCVIASLSMIITLAISCLCVSERDPRLEGEPAKQEAGVFAFFKGLYRSIGRLPPQIKAVCIVQLAAWIGWFPFLFYITTYVGQLHVDPMFRKNPNMTNEQINQAWQQGTRVGTLALLVYALVSFSASVALPWFIASSYKPPHIQPRTPMTPTTPLATRAAGNFPDTGGHGYFEYQASGRQAGAAVDGLALKGSSTAHKWFARVTPNSLEIPWLTLKRAWLLSHLVFALLTWLTFFAHNTTTAIILAGLIGIPWAMTMWAPFALIAAEISKRDNIRRGLLPPPPTTEGEMLARGEDDSEGSDQAGVVLGIHNVAIAAPQVIATLVSSAIFKALQKPRGAVGDDSVAWVLRFGGLCALVAAWLTRRVKEEGEDVDSKPKW